MRLSLHVDENGPYACPPADSLHPTQGSLPCGMLDSQPPLQLLATFSSAAILPSTESGAGDDPRADDDDVWVVLDLRCDTPVFAACAGRLVRAACFGASTVMDGSGLAESVCDAAVPHSRTVDNTATVEGATRLGDNLMTCPPKSGTEQPSRDTHGTIHPGLRHRGLKLFPQMTAHRHGVRETTDRSRHYDVRLWRWSTPSPLTDDECPSDPRTPAAHQARPGCCRRSAA